ncbi:hypothetical protein KGM_206722 [Danaus plexippus plexippus]|uniref:Sugar transporter SWEET n=1 Tax=Danaus plexippus plexippus TaxID=278856 RepID=A0A212ENU7_DANPL|nr:sugar transporter SWEET1 [Danaus plexippus plexippus]OWR43121.1 hypothetical protein KGM_206722 [Danaus plexippus plexippus]
MEVVSDILQPYKELVGTVAGIVTTGQMFSGSFICYDIYKQGNTKGTSIMVFIGGFIMSILNIKFGFILRDDMMIKVNFVGLMLNIVYLMVFFHYTAEKGQAWFNFGIGGAVSAGLIAYSEMEDPTLIENRFGTIITIFMFYLISSPLLGLKNIIKTKSTAGMPFPIIFSGTIVTFMWLLYGIILKNKFLVLQNTVALVLCSIQLSLFVIYPSKKSKEKKAKKSN